MEFTANQLAAMVNGTVEGDGNVTLNDFAKIEEGYPGALSFLANPKYTPYIYKTGSSAVLVRKDFVPESPVKATLIRVEDPYATVARLLTMAQQMMQKLPEKIETPSHIGEGVTLGERLYIGAYAYIGDGAKLGDDVKIYPQAYVGDGVEIGANTTVDRATMGSTVINRGVKLDNLIQIAHNCQIGSDTVMAAQAGVAGSTRIGERCMIGGQVGFAGHITVGNNVWIGANVTVPPGVTIGDNTTIGAGSVVTRDIPSNVVAAGNPCRVLHPLPTTTE